MKTLFKELTCIIFMLTTAVSIPSYAQPPLIHTDFTKKHASTLNSLNNSHELAKVLERLNLKETKKIAQDLLNSKPEKLPKIKFKNKSLYFKHQGVKYNFKHFTKNQYILNDKVIILDFEKALDDTYSLLKNILLKFLLPETAQANPYPILKAILYSAAFLFLTCVVVGAQSTLKKIKPWTGRKKIKTNKTTFDKFINKSLKNIRLKGGCPVGAVNHANYHSINYVQGIEQYCDKMASDIIETAGRHPRRVQPLIGNKVNPRFLSTFHEKVNLYKVGTFRKNWINNLRFLTCDAEHCSKTNSTENSYSKLNTDDQIIIETVIKNRAEMLACVELSLGRHSRLKSNKKQSETVY